MRAEFVSALAAAPGPDLSSLTAAVHSTSVVHSPVPYILYGIGLMLGCIAASLIMLICILKTLDNGRGRQATGAEDAEDGSHSGASMRALLVVMAGEDRPTFIATSRPLSSPPAAAVELTAMA